ncbi:MAG: alpha/beta hydrolase [Verrucomicrobia bacterium]|nr:alpha/beta hydrolase [Verrucomicrobiota bacterium]
MTPVDGYRTGVATVSVKIRTAPLISVIIKQMKHTKRYVIATILVLAVLGISIWYLRLPFHHFPILNTGPSEAELANARHGHPIIRPSFADLSYAKDSPFEKLDLYLPKNPKQLCPVVIWIHGGGLILGDKRSMPQSDFGPAPIPKGPYGPYQVQVPDVAMLLSHGYAVVGLNYRLGVSVFTAGPNALRDCKAAVRFLRAHAKEYQLDSSRFAVWGNSMGGYLAAMLGATGDQPTGFDEPRLGNNEESSGVQAVIVWYGAEDRMPGERLSIQHYLSSAKKVPPFLIVNGDRDPVISPEQARRLHENLLRVSAQSVLTIVPGAGHEDPLFTKTQMTPAIEFLDRTIGSR